MRKRRGEKMKEEDTRDERARSVPLTRYLSHGMMSPVHNRVLLQAIRTLTNVVFLHERSCVETQCFVRGSRAAVPAAGAGWAAVVEQEQPDDKSGLGGGDLIHFISDAMQSLVVVAQLCPAVLLGEPLPV
ncbi:unnamed protein product [Pleuronectes platessa]|uniref:Uncharacterized protein n=1 Tax=Pleuronectes platessa TaxID=8262 RepID=A0A9N7UFJ0_PLEPL|nr:unnamed protein product [Pleuronectes platessa]